MLEEACEGRVERAVTRPEAREGKDALAAEFLDQSPLGEDDAEDVPEGGQGDEDGEGALGAGPEDVAEEGGGDEALGGEQLGGGDGGEVGDVDEHVEDCDGGEGQRRGDLEGAHGVLGLREGVVGVGVPDVRPDDVVEGGDDAVGGARGAAEGVREVVWLGVDLEGAAEGGPAGDDDDEDDDELDYAEEVLEAKTPF